MIESLYSIPSRRPGRQVGTLVCCVTLALALGGCAITRNNDLASSSRSVLTGRQSLEPSTSQDRRRATADLTASWNVLDFGVSYYQAQQQADPRDLLPGMSGRAVLAPPPPSGVSAP